MTVREEYFQLGKELVERFMEHNGIHVIPIIPTKRGPATGWYRNNLIFVNVPKTTVPAKVPGYSWSYPGYKADRTGVGVAAHECGHYIWDLNGMYDKSQNVQLICDWKEIIGGPEPKVSGYEPNPSEAFAEAVKLFITNPDLLKEGRPNRYYFLIDEIGLKPLEMGPWQEVLKDAHPKFHEAAKKWIVWEMPTK